MALSLQKADQFLGHAYEYNRTIYLEIFNICSKCYD